MLDHPKFMDVATCKVGAQIEYEHVTVPLILSKSFLICKVQEALGKAIELTGNKAPPEKEVADMLAENAAAYGFPTEMSQVVNDTFATNVCSFMSQNFKTILPVSI